MKIQFVRLELDVCEQLNQLAEEQRRTVSELTNEMLRSRLVELGMLPPETASSR